jgi:hypothetical protein
LFFLLFLLFSLTAEFRLGVETRLLSNLCQQFFRLLSATRLSLLCGSYPFPI